MNIIKNILGSKTFSSNYENKLFKYKKRNYEEDHNIIVLSDETIDHYNILKRGKILYVYLGKYVDLNDVPKIVKIIMKKVSVHPLTRKEYIQDLTNTIKSDIEHEIKNRR